MLRILFGHTMLRAMDVKTAIDSGDGAKLAEILAREPAQANAMVRWCDLQEHLTHPLHYVCDKIFDGTLTQRQSVSLVRALLAAGADLDYGNGDPLNAAASLGAVDVAIVLLNAGARPELRGPGGETALHWAAFIGADKLVARLIAEGAPIDVKDSQWDSTPLGWALHAWKNYPPPANQRQHREVALRLSRAGARVEPEWRDAFRALVGDS